MSHLITEILLRLSKWLFAAIIGAVVYLLAIGPAGVAGSFELALMCWIAGGVAILLLESSPI